MSTTTRKTSRVSFATTSADTHSSSSTGIEKTRNQQPLNLARREDEALESYVKWSDTADRRSTGSAQWDYATRKQSDAAGQFAALANEEREMYAHNGQKGLANDRDFSARE